MCAIAGLLNLPADKGILDAMLKTMERRGPDGCGRYAGQECTLLHTRLAIIDPEGGAQPMRLNWGDETYVLTYNGELYNTDEIRGELTALGHSFQGHSDTEVVLHSFAQWGQDCLERFNGIFAFGVWLENRKELFLARDRIGVKPLFFMEHRDGFLFASEMKTILAYPTITAALDWEGAVQLLMLGPGRIPGSGVFHGMRELEPGQWARIRDGKLTVSRYWKLTDGEHRDSFEDTVQFVRQLVLDAIRRQMVSDVPIGTFLSGGLDSSIISAVCAEKMRQEGKVLDTFSVDYLNNSAYFVPNKFQPESDSHYIHKMQTFIQSRHHWTVLTSDVLDRSLREATWARDLPGMADVDFSLLAFCGEIRKNVKVALSGECADEIFGGYPWYRDPDVRQREGFPWSQNIRQRQLLIRSGVCADPAGFVMDAYRTTCAESDILPDRDREERRMKEMVNLNFRWFMQTLLDRKDRMSMYSGLEVRVPFCDYRIAEYLYRIPWEMKDYQSREKGLLRKAMEGLLPEEVLYRKKSPYPKTFDPAYETMMENRLEETLNRSDSPLLYLTDKDGIRACLADDSPWPWYGQLMRRPQTIAYLLQLDYWLRQYKVRFLF